MKKAKGFTLIELMIVVTVIAIIIAIAVPNLLRARIQANEKNAIISLRAISTAQISYHGANQNYGTFGDLAGKVPPWLDESFADGTVRSGYRYVLEGVGKNSYVCFAEPVTVNYTGNHFYRVDETGVIRYSAGGRPGPDDTPLPDPPGGSK